MNHDSKLRIESGIDSRTCSPGLAPREFFDFIAQSDTMTDCLEYISRLNVMLLRRSTHRVVVVRFVIGLVLLVCVLGTLRHLPRHRKSTTTIQYDFTTAASLAQAERLHAVQREFIHAWTGYKDHGWMSDSLRPLTGERQDHLCGWPATLIDSLDTLYIMDMKEEFNEAVNASITIDFEESTARCQVNFFESTIRYLGGLLGAYDLSGDARLLPKLVELGELLYSAFNTANGMSCSHCSLGRSKSDEMIVPDQSMPLADAASFYLEFTRLWQITGDRKYLDKISSITAIYQKAQLQSSIPGLWP